jgi:hypothetical protein
MPRRDGTGPNGTGSLTGKRMGNCVRGLGNGMGYCRGSQVYSDTKQDLQKEKELLVQRIKDIEKKLEE